MIPLSEINYFANNLHVPAETIEKDYIISWILYCLTRSSLKHNFIFYGGTAIKRIFFEEHRFSEDIDLLSSDVFTLNHILDQLDCLKYAKDEANIILNINQDNIIATKDRIQLYVNYSSYNEIIGAPKEIRLDFCMDMQLFGQVSKKNVIETYSDLKNRNINLSVMTLNTILSNKLGLLSDRSRNEPRDIFDIWFLLQRIKNFEFNIDEVSKAYKEKYGYSVSLGILLSALKNSAVQKNWELRLSKQISQLPDSKKIIKDIISMLQEIFIADLDENNHA